MNATATISEYVPSLCLDLPIDADSTSGDDLIYPLPNHIVAPFSAVTAHHRILPQRLPTPTKRRIQRSRFARINDNYHSTAVAEEYNFEWAS
mmetsp:Transcript_28414/g.59996  ORF Transcript_28414/g.59996 Transcript_28414/m.59996 type:complete len:92 (+) Transcript_28414:267-542(+)